jgi:outer membrane receptor protein involved in Fe transport
MTTKRDVLPRRAAKFQDSARDVRSGVQYFVHATIAVALATAMYQTARAQEVAQPSETDQLQEVLITGSRIQRSPDLQSSSPLVTVTSDTLTNISTVGVENALNQLPQFVPAQTQFVTNDNSPSAQNVPGAATINLRGLGTNRTLVLLDGRRAQPSNIALVVDVNSIPAAAVDHVEVVTGGASAVYGADAIAGVVNFRLKNHFQGAELDAQSGLTEKGDGAESRLSATLGTDFAEHRGNIISVLEWAKRDAVYQSNRSFYTDAWVDPYSSPGQRQMFTFNDYNPGTNAPTKAAANSLFGRAVDNTTAFFFNNNVSNVANTTLFKSDAGCSAANGGVATVGLTSPIPSNTVAQAYKCGGLSQSYEQGLVSSPLTRYSMFTKVNYQLFDNVTAFFQGNFESSDVISNTLFTPSRSSWSLSIPYCNPQNMGTYTAATCAATDAAYPVPAQMATLLNSRPNSSGTWTLESTMSYLGPRIADISTKVYQVMAGLDGTLPVRDWTWEAYVSHGETNVNDNMQSGFASVQNYQGVVLNNGLGANGSGAATGAYGVGYSQSGYAASIGANASCTSGLPIFNPYAFPVSSNCIAAIGLNMNTTTTLRQDIVEVSTQGGIVNLPAGELRGSLGADWRRDYGVFTPDPDLSSSSVYENVAGTFATAGASGATEVKEAYAELLVPLLKDLPAMKSVNLELGDRLSKYNTSGSTQTWKALLNWAPVDWLTFRGGMQYAVRAPNVAELYVGNSVVTSVLGPYGDPCISGGPTGKQVTWGNNVNNPNLAQVQALCRALVAGTHPGSGIGPAAANAIDFANWQGGNANITTSDNEIQQGNPNLKPEKAHTLTVGAVLRSPFDSPALHLMTATVDYYRVRLSDTIGVIDSLTVYENCFNYFGTNPGYSPTNPYCNLITRDSKTGGRSSTAGLYTNLGSLNTDGLDFTFSWRSALSDMFGHNAPGALGFHVAGTWLMSYKAQTAPSAAILEYAGTGSTTGSSYFSYRTMTGLSYEIGPASVAVDWSHLPSLENTIQASQPNTTILPAAKYDLFNLSAGWEFSPKISMRFGVDNLFDKLPPVVGAQPGVTDGAGSTNPSVYDVLGRRFYLSFKAKL